MARKVANEAERASEAKVRAAKEAVVAAEAARDATAPTAKMAETAAAVSALVLESAREMKEAMRAVRSTVSLRLSMEKAMLAQGEAVASLHDTYGRVQGADEAAENEGAQDEAARGLSASLVEACKDK